MLPHDSSLEKIPLVWYLEESDSTAGVEAGLAVFLRARDLSP